MNSGRGRGKPWQAIAKARRADGAAKRPLQSAEMGPEEPAISGPRLRHAGASGRDNPAMQPQLDSSPALRGAAQALRELGQGRGARMAGVFRGVDKRLLALVDPAGQRVYSTRPLERIVDALASGTAALGALDPNQDHAPRAGRRLADESLERFAWLMGARLGRDVGLAPWLDPMLTYRLLRWPDFGEIGSDPQAAQLCKVIAKSDLGIAGIVDTAQLPRQRVLCLLNSLSLCGALASGATPPAAPRRQAQGDTAPWPDGWFARLWRRLRGR